MRIESAEVVSLARTMIGTPFHHGGRLPGIGLDCVGLLVAVWSGLGVEVEDLTDYAEGDWFEELRARLARHAEQVAEPRPGDVLLMRRVEGPADGQFLQHVALVGDGGTMIHAWSAPTVMRVVEHPITHRWSSAVDSVWRHRGLR